MEQLILFVFIWIVVFFAIPFDRVKELSIAGAVAFIWMVFVDNISASLGYYSYQHSILSIGKAPVFQNLFEAGLGILLINWFKENSLSKLTGVIVAGLGFVAIHNFYIQRGVFAYGSFDNTLNFIHHIAALSVFTWISLAAVGERKVYSGDKWRRKVRQIA